MEGDYNLDCCISREKEYFRYRAAAVIIEDDCLLMASNKLSNYYCSVGGVHLG